MNADITAVVITRNQEWNVARLLESVLAEPLVSEVVLVDSASTDGTIEVAKRFPVRILQLHPDQRLSAAAGRYVGLANSTGDLTLFLDGDTELHPGWLVRAVSTLRQHQDVAAVTGMQIHLPIAAVRNMDAPAIDNDTVEDVLHTGGSGLFRRPVLEAVGSFNPHLFSDEEPELCIRIRNAGHRLVRTQHPMIWEYTDPKDEWRTILARRRRRLYIGAGQNLRLHFGRPTFSMYVRERAFGIIPLVAIVLGLTAVVVAFSTSNFWIIPTLAGVMLVGLMIEAIRRGSISSTLKSVLLRLAIAEGTVRGLFISTPESHEYAARFDVVQ